MEGGREGGRDGGWGRRREGPGGSEGGGRDQVRVEEKEGGQKENEGGSAKGGGREDRVQVRGEDQGEGGKGYII